MSSKQTKQEPSSTRPTKYGRLRKKENIKRLYFIIKILIFIFLILLSNQYPIVGETFQVTSYQVSIVAYYVLSNIIITIIRLILVNLYVKRHNLKNNDKDNFILGVDRIASLLSIFIFIISIFYFFQISPKDFLTSISLVAVALVLLFKDYISNLMNGMIMMFSDQFHLNDYIKVGEFKGRIIDINLANVKLQSDEGELMYIPNNLVYLKEVVNFSKSSSSVVIVDFDLNLKLFGSLQKLEAYLSEKISEQFNNHTKAENVTLKVERIKKEEALIKLIVVLNRQNKRLERIVHRYSNFMILEFINKELQSLSVN